MCCGSFKQKVLCVYVGALLLGLLLLAALLLLVWSGKVAALSSDVNIGKIRQWAEGSPDIWCGRL